MEAIFLEEVKLDLMDWKNAEKVSEERIKELKLEIVLNEMTRIEAKKQIKSFGGVTSEQERAIEKEDIKRRNRTSTS